MKGFMMKAEKLVSKSGSVLVWCELAQKNVSLEECTSLLWRAERWGTRFYFLLLVQNKGKRCGDSDVGLEYLIFMWTFLSLMLMKASLYNFGPSK